MFRNVLSSFAFSALMVGLGVSEAHANRLDHAHLLSVTCTSYEAQFVVILTPNTTGHINYSLTATPVGPGSPVTVHDSAVAPAHSLPWGAAVTTTDSGTWSLPPGTYSVTGSVVLQDATGPVYLDHFENQPLTVVCDGPPPPVCGNGVVEQGEQCDDGNTVSGDGCSATCQNEPPPPGGGQGCTPGYWKQPHHLDSWVSYSPSQSYATVFGVTPSFSATLLGALKMGGGGEAALARHAVAALLNAAALGGDFAFTQAQVIALVKQAYATGKFEAIKDRLAAQNEMGCPLN